MLQPIIQMRERYLRDKEDSDVSAFLGLMYFGELITKLVVSTFASGILDDRNRNRYGILRELVHADGIGEWSSRLDLALTGPSAQFLRSDLQLLRRELMQRTSGSDWQFDSIRLLHEAARGLGVEIPPLQTQASLQRWFALFAVLRNKTRGHGATLSTECSNALGPLEQSIQLIIDNLSIFTAEWAHLHRNLSGKYRVTSLSPTGSKFKYLRESKVENFPDGNYIFLESPLRIELIETDSSVGDFFFPNGQFRGAEYEVISYVTNQKRRINGKDWLAPAIQLPDSETHGAPDLIAQGQIFSNIPTGDSDYIDRLSLQNALESALLRDRHEIVSLAGPGGIGKTSLAISVIEKLSRESSTRFDIVVWFSARDIDLLPSGPKPVRPHGVSLRDFAAEYADLTSPANRSEKSFNPEQHLANALSGTPIGAGLYIFDNFETVTNTTEVFTWIDTYIRPPNKALITTRTRDFVGDLPIEVTGMTEIEATRLIDAFALKLGISDLLTKEYKQALIDESSGHPYVIKIMLGEVSKLGRLVKPQRIIATQENILLALFERTYVALSPAAQRIFLLLSTWRSVVPAVAIEAVVMRSAEERIDVRATLDELKKLSLLEEISGSSESEVFVSIPLAAMTFGQRKLNASPLKAVIDADSDLLQDFGTIRKDGTASGVLARISHLLRALARRVTLRRNTLESLRPMLDFVGSRVPAAWPEISRLYVEEGGQPGIEWAKVALRKYIESGDNSVPRLSVWHNLVGLCNTTGDIQGELQSLAELSNDPSLSIGDLSELADGINRIFANAKRMGNDPFQPDERKYLVAGLIKLLEGSLNRLDATDLSRLSWLYLHSNEEGRANELALMGLALDSENEYCRKIAVRLRRT